MRVRIPPGAPIWLIPLHSFVRISPLFINYEEKLLAKRLSEVDTLIKKRNFQKSHTVNLPKPVDLSEKYEKYISMLELSTKETMIIDSDQHDCFVLDKWDWAETAKMVNTMYLSNA